MAPVASRSDSADPAAAARAGEEATNSPMPNASRVARADVADVYPPIRGNQGGGLRNSDQKCRSDRCTLEKSITDRCTLERSTSDVCTSDRIISDGCTLDRRLTDGCTLDSQSLKCTYPRGFSGE